MTDNVSDDVAKAETDPASADDTHIAGDDVKVADEEFDKRGIGAGAKTVSM